MNEKYNDLLNPMEIDAIGEILNISLGSSATAISDLLSKRVNITTPFVRVLSIEEFEFGNLEPAIGVEITYVQGLEGSNIMLLKRLDVKKILEILMGGIEIADDEFVLDEISLSAVCEVMNQMMGASATAMADFLGEPVNISTPLTFEIDDTQEFKNKYFSAEEPMIVVSFSLDIEDTLNSEFVTLMSISLAKRLISSFGILSGDAEPAAAEPVAIQEPVAAEPAAPAPPPVAEPAAQAAVAPQPMQQPQAQPAPPVYAEPRVINTTPIQNEYFGEPSRPAINITEDQSANLDLIMSVPLQLSVEIGRTKKQVKEILDFNQGTLVVLDKLAGDQVDVYVNGQCIAKGDVVVVDDSFGVRITEIIKKVEMTYQK